MSASHEETPDPGADETSLPAYNPYAPPVVERAPRRKGAPRVDWVNVGMIGFYVLLNTAALLEDVVGRSGESTSSSAILRALSQLVGVFWLARRWSGIPVEAQRAIAGKRVGTWAAVLLHMLPLIQFFWLFKAQIALRDGVNMALRKNAAIRRAPTQLAILAPLLHICAIVTSAALVQSGVSWVPVILSEITWTAHMIFIERAWAYRKRAVAQ